MMCGVLQCSDFCRRKGEKDCIAVIITSTPVSCFHPRRNFEELRRQSWKTKHRLDLEVCFQFSSWNFRIGKSFLRLTEAGLCWAFRHGSHWMTRLNWSFPASTVRPRSDIEIRCRTSDPDLNGVSLQFAAHCCGQSGSSGLTHCVPFLLIASILVMDVHNDCREQTSPNDVFR